MTIIQLCLVCIYFCKICEQKLRLHMSNCRGSNIPEAEVQGSDLDAESMDAESVDAGPIYNGSWPMQGNSEVAPPTAGML